MDYVGGYHYDLLFFLYLTVPRKGDYLPENVD